MALKKGLLQLIQAALPEQAGWGGHVIEQFAFLMGLLLKTPGPPATYFLLAAATCAGPGTAMPKCPKCDKEVYFAERVTSLGKDWHRPCLKCEKCGKTLTSGGHAEHEGKPYCNHPCYSAMFGPKGFGRGGAESHTFK